MREGAGGITVVRHRRAGHGRGVHARRPAVRRRAAQRRGARARRRRSRVRSAPRSRGPTTRVRQRQPAAHRRARRQRAGSSPARAIPTSRGAAPTSSPPRRCIASAATGGAPTARAIAACRVDNGPVPQWHIADPADPRTPPNVLRYPAAGTANPDVSLHVLALDGGSVEVAWDRQALPVPRRR